MRIRWTLGGGRQYFDITEYNAKVLLDKYLPGVGKISITLSAGEQLVD